MSVPRYGQIEQALKRNGFVRAHSGPVVLWQRIGVEGLAQRVILANDPLLPVPSEVLSRLLAQAGLKESELEV